MVSAVVLTLASEYFTLEKNTSYFERDRKEDKSQLDATLKYKVHIKHVKSDDCSQN